MEIRDMLLASKARASLLLIVPVLAMVAAYVFASQAPPRYEVTATYVVPSFLDTNSPAALSQSVASFRSTVSSEPIIRRAAEETGIPRSVFGRGATTRPLGTGNVLELSLISPDSERAGAALVAVVATTLDLLSETRIRLGEEVLAAAQERYDVAREKLEAFVDDTGLVLPNETYRIQFSELAQLRLQVQSARAAGDEEGAVRLEALVKDREPLLADLNPQVLQHRDLERDENRQLTLLLRAEERFDETRLARSAEAGEVALAATAASLVPQRPLLVRWVVSAGALALIAAFGLVLLLGIVARPREAVVGEDTTTPLDEDPASGAEMQQDDEADLARPPVPTPVGVQQLTNGWSSAYPGGISGSSS
jgi:hypothetical protein